MCMSVYVRESDREREREREREGSHHHTLTFLCLRVGILFSDVIEHDGCSLVLLLVLKSLISFELDRVVKVEAGHGNGFIILTARKLTCT